MAQARASISVDNERVRVTTWTFQDGEATGPHVHEFDYVVVPITGGRFVITDRDGGVRELEQEAASPYFGHVGAAHDVVNESGQEAAFIEIELK